MPKPTKAQLEAELAELRAKLEAATKPKEPKDDFDTDRWCTPPTALGPVEDMWPQAIPIGLDPCWDPESIVRALAFCDIREGHDGLEVDWCQAIDQAASKKSIAPRVRSVFYNPPYSNPGPFVAKAARQAFARERFESIGLLPVSTDVEWWDKWIWGHARALCYVRGRFNFLKHREPVKGTRHLSVYALHASDDMAESAVNRFGHSFAHLGRIMIRRGSRWGW